MSHSPLLFNPSRASFEELDATFIGRRPLLEQLETNLIADSKKKTRRHWQLIGPRGSGKSHLSELLVRRLARLHGWAVARLPEEHYQISNVGELLEQIVIHLEDCTESPLSDIDNAVDLEDQALDRIRQFRAKTEKPVLVVLENLGILFERKLRDQRSQSRLREILTRDPPFTLVCTATSYVDATVQHSAPFYDFFQVVTLEDLSPEEVAELVEARARWDMDELLLTQADTVRARIRAVFHFSGGNPRLVLALYSILRGGFTDELHTQLLKLLDEVTPYYQQRLADISPQMGRILAEMALTGSSLTPSDVGKRCRMPVSHVTANIAKLMAERFVRPTGRPDKRRRYYDLNDRLFRLWMQMREDHSSRHRLRFLSEFFQHWYEGHPDEVRDVASRVAEAFWSALRGDATQRCQEHLVTLDYLQGALPGHSETLIQRITSRTTASREEAEDLVRRLRPLFATDHTSAKAVAGVLLGSTLEYLQRGTEALTILESADSSDVPDRIRYTLWSTLLGVASRTLGPEKALEKGLTIATQIPTLLGLGAVLSRIAIDAKDVPRGRQILGEYLSTMPCDRCASRAVRAFLAKLVMNGYFDDLADTLLRFEHACDFNDDEKQALRIMGARKPQKSKPERVLAAVNIWKQLSDVPDWLLWRATCTLSHSRAHALQVFPLIVQWVERGGLVERHTIYHLLLSALEAAERPELLSERCRWIASHVPAAELRSVFTEWMPNLVRNRPEGASPVLSVYSALRSLKMLPVDLVPYSSAVEVCESPARITAMPPEVREAVELLMRTPADERPMPNLGRRRRPTMN